MKSKLGLSADKIAKARKLSSDIVRPVQDFIERNTTVTVERSTLRLMGVDYKDSDEIPVPNIIVDQLKEKLEHGVSKYYINALLKTNKSVEELNKAIGDENLDISEIPLGDFQTIKKKSVELIETFKEKVKKNTKYRNEKLEEYKENIKSPMLYVIVATGNIYEDVKQAQSAVYQGADVVAVIRTTAQSLLDYVPYGATTEGFGGTYATQENFKIMRKALDEVGDKQKRYIRLVNYCSGLCMPEIAVMGAFERLDMMLNDSMYGILFRDINMYRTFVDQNFSRMINSYADVIINTGEDNYLTTSDAYEKANTVLASQFLNEKFAQNAGMPSKLMGLGHAFEMNPELENGFLYEYSQALMAREIFPDAPLKYMPPTKYMTGNIFKGHAMNTMFNFVSKATNQGIHLLGMLTEAIHTPHMQDRYLAIENAQYVMNNMKGFFDEIDFKKDGIIVKRAHEVLDNTIEFLNEINDEGLLNSIEKGKFAEVKRPKDRGKGLAGVVAKSSEYWNPFEDFLIKELNAGGKK
ncbi:MAG: lysine 5,6-aminomutase subunit alpha [Candidatus Muirbacterium halophilum]|nr:lysine 5,6-aminomutase subunit alpha [Candidatus Muirbacterium halophilum]MCK9475137.1 lysine 5,6-aminomutase subunit alpha [Candidatus Muirbacterium halophilum]